MNLPSAVFRSILDSVTEHIVVIDQDGSICYVNAAWKDFGIANDCLITEQWVGVNYLTACDESATKGDPHGKKVASGTREVISGKVETFYYEYPCHSPTEKRWFMMRVVPLQWARRGYFIISHQNITERKLAEETVRVLSLEDQLTGIANRRRFDDFLASEWRRGQREDTPLSLVLLDVDHFKLFNDQYGHPAGDMCLKQIGVVLKLFGNRPGDLCARYGGEEFALVLGNTDLPSASQIAEAVRKAIQALAIAHKDSTVGPVVTASLGVATFHPCNGGSVKDLIEAADQALYAAKDGGRNQISAFGEQTGQGSSD